jgi:hypothetical protein
MPRPQRPGTGRPVQNYGKSITNIKKSIEELLREIFSDNFVLERVKVAPTIVEFSVEEPESSRRHLQIIKRLANTNQSLPAIVISDFSGKFAPGQVGDGPSESYIDPVTGVGYLGYTITAEGVLTLDIFASDTDTRDALGDALTTGLQFYLKDIYNNIHKQFNTGKYSIQIDSVQQRRTGSDQNRQDDPEQKIMTETIEITVFYEETAYIEAPPAVVYQDAEDLGIGGFVPVFDSLQEVQLQIDVPSTLKIGVPFRVRILGGSGFFQYGTPQNSGITIGVDGTMTPMASGQTSLSVVDTMNQRVFYVPVTVIP